MQPTSNVEYLGHGNITSIITKSKALLLLFQMILHFTGRLILVPTDTVMDMFVWSRPALHLNHLLIPVGLTFITFLFSIVFLLCMQLWIFRRHAKIQIQCFFSLKLAHFRDVFEHHFCPNTVANKTHLSILCQRESAQDGCQVHTQAFLLRFNA